MPCKYLSRDKNTDYVCGNAPHHTCQQWEDWTVGKFLPTEEMKDLFCEQQDENFVPICEA